MGKKKKINELEDRYYDLLNENSVLEDRVKDFERRHAKDISFITERIEKSECAHSYEGGELKKLNEKIKSMEDQIKVLNNRTIVDYAKHNVPPIRNDEITFEDCNKILEWCGKRGATKEELDGLRLMFNKYVFYNSPFELFPIKEDNND